MRVPALDARKEKDILHRIGAVSAAYTPEWRFDEKNPDVGTALAMIYAELFAGTLSRFNRMPERHHTAFLNEIGAQLLPAIPAAGYAAFGLAQDDVGGVPVPAGTRLIADTSDEENPALMFETENDVYVTPSYIRDIFCVSGEQDRICRVFQQEGEQATLPFSLFRFKGENLQRHVFSLSHRDALCIPSAATVELTLFPYQKRHIPHSMMEALTDPSNVLWEYSTEAGFCPFGSAQVRGGTLVFQKSGTRALGRAVCFGEENFWIRCTVQKAAPFADFVIDRMELSVSGVQIKPTVVQAAGVEQNVTQCFPFGEKMSVYSDVYFACNEALSKRGAQVQLDFNLSFLKIPVDLELSDPSINWKLIMKRSEFQPDREFDITIEQVIWEYYNGQGWARLFPGEQYEDCFGTASGTIGQFRSIQFRCPQDMTPILVGSCESCYLRARILKVNNAYKTRGNYITPYIEQIFFSYSYGENAVIPEHLFTVNQLEEEHFQTGDLRDRARSILPVRPLAEQAPMVCFGFARAPQFGPIKILFTMGSELVQEAPRLAWEYWNGRVWAKLSPVDETRQFSKTGILTFLGSSDFASRTLFGAERYWIRAVDHAGYYGDPAHPVPLPQVTGIFMNATSILHVHTRPEERFFIEPHQMNARCQLLHGAVQDLAVEVDEISQLDETAVIALERQGLAQITRDAAGHLQEVWVHWTQVEDFSCSCSGDRHYMADKNTGSLFFSDGMRGRIPPVGDRETIRVNYSTGGGAKGNLPAGMIVRSERSLGFVSRVTNPVITAGGCDQETVQQAAVRCSAALGHSSRAVTARDYELLAFEATRAIWSAKCFAGYNKWGQRQAGAVTLVVLQKDFLHGRKSFSGIRRQITDYIAGRISGNLAMLGRVAVAQPQFLEMCVRVDLTVGDFNQVFRAKELVEARLEQFLHPVTGNFDGSGWKIGTLPNATQILNTLRDIQEIQLIQNIRFTAYTQGESGREEADLEQTSRWVFGLPLSGTHEVVITVDERR